MSEPFLSEIKIISWNFAPKGWAFCNGQTMPINQNQALFSLLGTIYGGDGRQTFGIPNLQGRIPIHLGAGFSIGQLGGEVSHTLTVPEMAAHNHPANGSSSPINTGSPANNYWGDGTAVSISPYSASSISLPMAGNAIGMTGSGQAHPNQSPYLVLNCIIALQGIFPSQT